MVTELLLAAAAAWLVLFPLLSRPVALGGLICLHVVADAGASGASGGEASGGYYLKAAIWGALFIMVLGTMEFPIPRRARSLVFWSLLLIAVASVVALLDYGWNLSLRRDIIQYTSYLFMFVMAMRWGTHDVKAVGRTLIAATTLPLALVAVGGLGRIDYFLMAGRATGAFSHPNAAAAFAGVAFVVAAALLVFTRYRTMLIPLLLSGIAMVLATSMTTLVAVGASLLLLFLLSRSVSFGTKARFLALIFVAGLAITSIPIITERIASFANVDAETALASGQSANSFEWRLINWDLLLQAWKERPIFGYGLGSTAEFLMPLGSLPHSMPIEILVEFGAVALAIILLLGGVSVVAIARHRKHGGWEADLLGALLAYIIVGGVTSNLIDYNGPIALVLMVSGLLIKRLASSPPDCAGPRSSSPGPMEVTVPPRLQRRNHHPRFRPGSNSTQTPTVGTNPILLAVSDKDGRMIAPEVKPLDPGTSERPSARGGAGTQDWPRDIRGRPDRLPNPTVPRSASFSDGVHPW